MAMRRGHVLGTLVLAVLGSCSNGGTKCEHTSVSPSTEAAIGFMDSDTVGYRGTSSALAVPVGYDHGDQASEKVTSVEWAFDNALNARSSSRRSIIVLESSKDGVDPLSAAFVQVGARASHELYLLLFKDAIRGLLKPNPKCIFSRRFMRGLNLENPIFGSMLSEQKSTISFVNQIEKVVQNVPPEDIVAENKEFAAVVRVIKRDSGMTQERLSKDPNIILAIRHLIHQIRDGKKNGVYDMMDALRTDALFTVATTFQYITSGLGLNMKKLVSKRVPIMESCFTIAVKLQSLSLPDILLPGGVVGLILRIFLRTFNLILYPSLLSFTGVAMAMGFACLMGVPLLLRKLYKHVGAALASGTFAIFKNYQLFVLRRDPHGSNLLKEALHGRIAGMISTLWKLVAVGSDAVHDIRSTRQTTPHNIFYHGFLEGILDFSNQHAALVEADYLSQLDADVTKCYDQDPLINKTKLQCESVYRRVETFTSRVQALVRYTSWSTFKDHIGKLVFMIYAVAQRSVEVQMAEKASHDIDLKLESDYVDEFSLSSTINRTAINRDVHILTTGVSGIVSFFHLRKLHGWKPYSVSPGQEEDTRSDAELERDLLSQSTESEKVSLASQSTAAFSVLDLPPELAAGAARYKIVEDDSLTEPEKPLLLRYASRRDHLMISLLRKSVGNVIGAFKGILGRLYDIVRRMKGDESVDTCGIHERSVCFSLDEDIKNRLLVVHIMLAAHMGVYLTPGGRFVAPVDALKSDFMDFLNETAWVRHRPTLLKHIRRKPRWALDLLVDHLFPNAHKLHPESPLSEAEVALIENAVITSQADAKVRRSRQETFCRLQCPRQGDMLILTNALGKSLVFKPSVPMTENIRDQLCTPEHQFVHFAATYTHKDIGGSLDAPGVGEIDGYLSASSEVMPSLEEDESMGFLIEAAIWSQGYSRLDARMAADLIVFTKTHLYPWLDWDNFFDTVTPVDMNYAQRMLSEGMNIEYSTYAGQEIKSLYSFKLSSENILDFVLNIAESTALAAGDLKSGLHDIALITLGYTGMRTIEAVKKNIESLTDFLAQFQELVWNEYAAHARRSSGVRAAPAHLHTSAGSTLAPPVGTDSSVLRENTDGPSISATFALEEGHYDITVEAWCEELYQHASNSPSRSKSADLSAHDAGIIQCSLLRLLAKRIVDTNRREKEAVFQYLRAVTDELRETKKTNRYKWKTYLNAKPFRRAAPKEKPKSILAALRRARITLKQGLAHKFRGQAAKRIFGLRAMNIIRGDVFLRVLHMAVLKAYPDPAMYPESTLIHPLAVDAFSRLMSLIRVHVQPIMHSDEGNELFMQVKMIPVPSAHVKRLISMMKRVLRTQRDSLTGTFMQRVRACAGYLALLHSTNAAPGLTSNQLGLLYSRFAQFLDGDAEASRQFILNERIIGYLAPGALLLMLKANEGVKVLEQLENNAHESLQLHSSELAKRLPLSTFTVSGTSIERPGLAAPRIVLFCEVTVSAVDLPTLNTQRKVAIEQLMHILQVTIDAGSHVQFSFDAEEDSIFSRAESLEALIEVLRTMKLSSPGAEETTAAAVFALRATILTSLEVMGLTFEYFDRAKGGAPVKCTPEDRESGVLYTLPINMSSWLRLATTASLQVAHVEDLADQKLQSHGKASAGVVPLHKEGLFPTKTESTNAASVLPQRAPNSPSDGNVSPDLTMSLNKVLNPTSSGRTKSSFENGPSANSTAEHIALGTRMRKTQEAVFVGMRSASATNVHIESQFSQLSSHASTFAGTFHTLLSVVRYETNFSKKILYRMRDELSVAIFGHRWMDRGGALSRGFSRLRKRLGARRLSRQRVMAQQAKPTRRRALPGFVDFPHTFYSLFLPGSFLHISNLVSEQWRRVEKEDILSMRRTACYKDTDMWQRETCGAEIRNCADEESGTCLSANLESSSSQRELCDSGFWLDLQGRVAAEQFVLESNDYIQYFMRMGVPNALLLEKFMNEVLLDMLFESIKIVRSRISPQKSDDEDTREVEAKARRALSRKMAASIRAVTPMHPLLEVESNHVVVSTFLENVLNNAHLTKDELGRDLSQLQQRALMNGAKFLVSKSAGVSLDDAHTYISSLLQSNIMTPSDASERMPTARTNEGVALDHETLQASSSTGALSSSDSDRSAAGGGASPRPGAGNEGNSIRDSLVQAYHYSYPLSLLTRPAIFNPTVVILEIVNHIIKPPSKVAAFLRRVKKGLRNLTTKSLQMLIKASHAFVRCRKGRK